LTQTDVIALLTAGESGSLTSLVPIGLQCLDQVFATLLGRFSLKMLVLFFGLAVACLVVMVHLVVSAVHRRFRKRSDGERERA
jgi:uncharacterized metal-binding protein